MDPLGQNAVMSDTPETPGPIVPPRRRSPRRRIVAVVAVLVVVGTAVWWRRTVTADPKLEFTLFNRVNRVEHDATGIPEGITRKENALGTQYEIASVPGQRIFVYTGLRNGGGQSVQIGQVPMAGFYYFGFDAMEVSPERDVGIGQLTTYEPFKPFTLRAGESRNVRLTFRLADCGPTDQQPGRTTVRGLLVRYKLLGLERAALAPFEKSVLAVPSIGQCEHPILDPAPTGSGAR